METVNLSTSHLTTFRVCVCHLQKGDSLTFTRRLIQLNYQSSWFLRDAKPPTSQLLLCCAATLIICLFTTIMCFAIQLIPLLGGDAAQYSPHF